MSGAIGVAGSGNAGNDGPTLQVAIDSALNIKSVGRLRRDVVSRNRLALSATNRYGTVTLGR